jgi:chromate transporter
MAARPTFRMAVKFWLKLGLLSFGGPAGQIALMHRELVEQKKWVEEARFLHALNFCMLLPGPEATQLATYCGWLMHGVRGGLVAGVLFVLPGALAMWGLSWIYVSFGAVPAVAGVLHGLKAAVLAILAVAVVRVGRKSLKTLIAWALAVTAGLVLALGVAPFPVVVVVALAVGFFGVRRWPDAFGQTSTAGASEAAVVNDATQTRTVRETVWIAGIGLALWFGPVVVAAWLQGGGGLFAQLGWFFSKAAVVTFGGAYAVLPYVGQQAVEQYQWVTPPQMLDGLALAETTPGPLILVLQYVGFLAGWAQPGGLSPLAAATWSAVMTTWVTFVPTFLFILVGAPYVERCRGWAPWRGALAAVTAAVVGVIAQLAGWFAWHALWPRGGSGGVDFWVLGLGVTAGVALQWGRVGLGWVVLASGLAGAFSAVGL